MSKNSSALDAYARFVKATAKAFALVVVMIILYMTLSETFEVVSRYIFNSPTTWVLETNTFALLFVCFMTAAYTAQTDGHVKVDILTSRLNPKVARIMAIITTTLALACSVVLVWQCWNESIAAFKHGDYSPDLRLSVFPLYGMMAIGCGVLCLQFALEIYELLTTRR